MGATYDTYDMIWLTFGPLLDFCSLEGRFERLEPDKGWLELSYGDNKYVAPIYIAYSTP